MRILAEIIKASLAASRRSFTIIIFIALFCFSYTAISATIDDISVISTITMDASVEAYSPFMIVNHVDKVPHVFWCRGGDIYHSYLKADGNWKAAEVIPDGGYNVFSVDEDEDLELHRKPIRNIAAEFDASGDIHFAFAEAGGGIYYMKRTGTTWSTPQLARQSSILKVNLDITKLNNRIFIGYEEGEFDQLYCVEFNGTSWLTPVKMGEGGEHCYLEQSPAGYVYFYGRGYSGGRNAIFAYLSGSASWTFVSNVTNAPSTLRLGAGPHMTVSNGRLFMAWPQLTSSTNPEQKCAIYCASALEPGTSWTFKYNSDVLFYANTGDPFPRMETYSDGTVLLLTSRRTTGSNISRTQYMIWDGSAWSAVHNAPWENVIAEIDCDGSTIWLASMVLSEDRPWWKGPITITGLKNNAVNVQLDPPTLSNAQKVNTNQLKLTFDAVDGATSYHVYRGTTYNFTPDTESGTNRIGTGVTDQDGSAAGVQWTDTDNAAGDPNTNYFYAVTAVNSVESDPSNVIGEFDYSLVTTATTSFNEIALPLAVSGITKASELKDAISNCNSIARWNASVQGYEQYVPGLSFTDFTVTAGYPYYVNVTATSIFTITGAVVAPTFTLVTTATTSFNEVVLPLNKTSITTASGLLADISNCNSIAKWDATIQGYYQYVPGLSFTNFATRVGYPYYVNVTSGSTWPVTGLYKSIPQIDAENSMINKSVPHIVYGQAAEADIAGFRAFVTGRENDVITEKSAGSKIAGNNFVLQASSFTGGWQKGDIVNISLFDKNGEMIGYSAAELSYEPYDQAKVETGISSTAVPAEFALMQNYPNPFNPETVIQYQIPRDALVNLSIYNINGQKVATLVNEYKSAGSYSILWKGTFDNGVAAPSGAYIYALKSGDTMRKMKAVLVK